MLDKKPLWIYQSEQLVVLYNHNNLKQEGAGGGFCEFASGTDGGTFQFGSGYKHFTVQKVGKSLSECGISMQQQNSYGETNVNK